MLGVFFALSLDGPLTVIRNVLSKTLRCGNGEKKFRFLNLYKFAMFFRQLKIGSIYVEKP